VLSVPWFVWLYGSLVYSYTRRYTYSLYPYQFCYEMYYDGAYEQQCEGKHYYCGGASQNILCDFLKGSSEFMIIFGIAAGVGCITLVATIINAFYSNSCERGLSIGLHLFFSICLSIMFVLLVVGLHHEYSTCDNFIQKAKQTVTMTYEDGNVPAIIGTILSGLSAIFYILFFVASKVNEKKEGDNDLGAPLVQSSNNPESVEYLTSTNDPAVPGIPVQAQIVTTDAKIIAVQTNNPDKPIAYYAMLDTPPPQPIITTPQ